MRYLQTLLATLALIAHSSSAPSPPCASGVHIIVARGTTELPGPGLTGLIISHITTAIPNSTVSPVDYPADFNLPSSPNAGIRDMTAQATSYAARCPDSKMVLMGYSQGAQVAGDTIAGGGTVTPSGARTEATPPLGEGVVRNVVAVVLFGDGNRVASPAYDEDTCVVSANHPRNGTVQAKFDSYAARIQDYCDEGDPVCCSTGDDVLAHLSYFNDANGEAVAAFVKSKFSSS